MRNQLMELEEKILCEPSERRIETRRQEGTGTNTTSNNDDTIERCHAAERKAEGLQNQLTQMELKFKASQLQLSKLQQQENLHLAKEEEMANVFAEQSAICTEMQVELEENRTEAEKSRQQVKEITKQLEGCLVENEILTKQAKELREIITEKQCQKNALVEECRQIQLQTTMLLINAGRYDKTGERAGGLKEECKEKADGPADEKGPRKQRKRKSWVQQKEEACTRRAAARATSHQEVQQEKRSLLQLLVSILERHCEADSSEAISLAALSTRIKQKTGKGWGGHWLPKHGSLLHFLRQHPEMFDVNIRSGVKLRF